MSLNPCNIGLKINDCVSCHKTSKLKSN